MSPLIDILILLDQRSVISRILFAEDFSDDSIREKIQEWQGIEAAKIPGAEWEFDQKIVRWNGLRFEFTLFSLNSSAQCLLLRREPLKEQLMEAALDLMADGIQLYGPDSSIQFFNRACKRLLDIPPEDSVEGQRLLDIFQVDKEFSTTLTALRTQTPVRNRFDCYKSTSGKELATVNASYPVLRADGTLTGTITLERDISMVRRQLPDLQYIQRVLTSHLSSTLLGEKTTRYTLDDLVGASPQMRQAVNTARQMAPKDINVLIQGETGTGKELFAQGIHSLSSRRNGKFVAVNCAAFPESLIEGMLFGTVKGAFTGSTDKAGLIETANHGTLFLDELNSMSLSMQAKLLRVLEEGTLQRVGSTKDIRVDIRVLSACNQDAFALMENGTLRRDLFYRLASAVVEIPPLRERMEAWRSWSGILYGSEVPSPLNRWRGLPPTSGPTCGSTVGPVMCESCSTFWSAPSVFPNRVFCAGAIFRSTFSGTPPRRPVPPHRLRPPLRSGCSGRGWTIWFRSMSVRSCLRPIWSAAKTPPRRRSC